MFWLTKIMLSKLSANSSKLFVKVVLRIVFFCFLPTSVLSQTKTNTYNTTIQKANNVNFDNRKYTIDSSKTYNYYDEQLPPDSINFYFQILEKNGERELLIGPSVGSWEEILIAYPIFDSLHTTTMPDIGYHRLGSQISFVIADIRDILGDRLMVYSSKDFPVSKDHPYHINEKLATNGHLPFFFGENLNLKRLYLYENGKVYWTPQ
jgi:hypothetical protein